MKIAILVDSSYDGGMKDYKDLYLAPLLINTEDNQTIYDDTTLNKDEFYELLSKQNLKTSQTPIGEMLKIWSDLLQEYDQIIFLPISTGLSGQFSTFRMMSETEDEYKGKVFVCDTKGVSVVNQEFVKRVARWIAENKTGFEILELVKLASADFFGYIIPSSLDTLKRGGRITPAAAAMAKILKIVPILKYDGIIDKETTARTFRKAVDEACNLIKKQQKGIKEVDVAYSRMTEEQLSEVKTIIASAGFAIRRSTELANVISAHTGPGTIAICAWKK